MKIFDWLKPSRMISDMNGMLNSFNPSLFKSHFGVWIGMDVQNMVKVIEVVAGV